MSNSVEAKVNLHTGDAITILKTLPDESIQMCVTSPPYYGLRKYLADDAPGKKYEIGLEQSPEVYVAKLVEVFREVRRVLRDDGVLFLNLGDSYWGAGGNFSDYSCGPNGIDKNRDQARPPKNRFSKWQSDTEDSIQVSHTSSKQGRHSVYKPKDLMGIPWMVAFALQADGWWLRQDIIWSKPNPMPESVTDRCTKAHEYIFMLSKSAQYYYDADAVREPYAEASLPRAMRGLSADNKWADGAPGSTAHSISQARPNAKLSGSGQAFGGDGHKGYIDANGRLLINPAGRLARSVWTITTKPFKEAHFATFPVEIPTRCIKAGSKPGDIVLDPFSGAGTTGIVCVELGRDYIGIDLNAEYNEMAEKRIAEAQLQIRMKI